MTTDEKDDVYRTLQLHLDEETIGFPATASGSDIRVHKALPNPVSIWATNFYAHVNPDLCSACGSCMERCQTGAMKLNDQGTLSVVDLTRCLGCGLCVTSCPTEAIELRRKEAETVPPATGEEMMEVIMTHKRARTS